MCQGTVQWFNRCKEHGIARPYDGNESSFIYGSETKKSSFNKQREQNVRFDLYLDCTLTATGNLILTDY